MFSVSWRIGNVRRERCRRTPRLTKPSPYFRVSPQNAQTEQAQHSCKQGHAQFGKLQIDLFKAHSAFENSAERTDFKSKADENWCLGCLTEVVTPFELFLLTIPASPPQNAPHLHVRQIAHRTARTVPGKRRIPPEQEAGASCFDGFSRESHTWFRIKPHTKMISTGEAKWATETLRLINR